MKRLSFRFARARSEAWRGAAWMLWDNTRDSEIAASFAYCLAESRLWRWIETAVHDMDDRRRKGVTA